MIEQKIGSSHWLLRWGIPVAILALAFFPRAVYPVSRTVLWYERAIHFTDALLQQDWNATYKTYHPGVTTMWLSGIGLKLFAWRQGLSSAQLLGEMPALPGTIRDATAAGVIPLALAIALCIFLCFFLLRRIFGQRVALIGGVLLALDPFHIGYSKVLHVDALVATFMLTSALFLLSYLRRSKRSDLILSGVFAGLSFLTKSPSLFLVPYAGLLVGMDRLVVPLWPKKSSQSELRKWGRRLWQVTRELLVWGAVAGVVFVALWPVMWVKPLTVLYWIMDRAEHHVADAHYNPIFFNGRIDEHDPGLPFYLATVAFKTTVVTLPMVCVALVFSLIRPRRSDHSRLVWLLVVWPVLFTVFMGLARFKQLAYVLPVFPMLDVLAALGLGRLAEAVGQVRGLQRWRWVPGGLVALALVLQAGVVLAHHPYYGTHHNYLLGGSKRAQRIIPLQHQGEGLDLAAQYLNTLPNAQHARAMVYTLGAKVFARHFLGATKTGPDPWIDYRVYYANQIMRKLGDEDWMASWETDSQREPLWSVAFDGVPYVWVYGTPPESLAAGGPEYTINGRLGEYIALKQVRLSTETPAPGDKLVIALMWESDAEIEKSYHVFCHIMSQEGDLVAQRDGPPLYGVRPTPSWRVGETIEDSYEILVEQDLAPGEYELSVGMYEPESLVRLPAYSTDGSRLPEDRIILGTIRVQIGSER